MLITRFCNLIGTANIPAAHTKTCPNTPNVCFDLPSFRRAQYTCARNIRLARETNTVFTLGTVLSFRSITVPPKHCVPRSHCNAQNVT